MKTPLAVINELAQKRIIHAPVFDIAVYGAEHNKTFTCTMSVNGFESITQTASSKEKAKRKAAELLLLAIESKIDINAKPKARRRVLEEAAGISGLYQRRHEAELKLRGSETNLNRVDDVVEQLDAQLGSLARQARQAKRYREIGNELRHSEGLLLYRRWREADIARQKASEELADATKFAANAQTEASQLLKARETYEDKVPPLREEEAISSAIVQRFNVQRDTLADEENRARGQIETLKSRIEQLGNDISRESGLNKDAEETIARLDWEQEQIEKASCRIPSLRIPTSCRLHHSRSQRRSFRPHDERKC